MAIQKLLIANRGEIALRIARAASALGIKTVAICSEDDVSSLHHRRADESRALRGVGAAAYLDAAQLIQVALSTGCDALHPGYGFLSESAEFARLCANANLLFVGPPPEVLALFGDKLRARKFAEELSIPVLRGASIANIEEAHSFFDSLSGAPVIVKAVAGGGGRGVRVIRQQKDVSDAFVRCQSEARASFGNDLLYIEELATKPRHIEVQIIADKTGEISHLYERECSLQRRHQKVIELAPSPSLTAAMRASLFDAAFHLARRAGYQNIGTFEFLVYDHGNRFAFMEANPRLQVEHPVTEAVTGIDLVCTQLELSAGATLHSLGLTQLEILAPRGYAIELRVNLETINSRGDVIPSEGTISAFSPPTGPGVRVDTHAYSGYTPSPNFDSLLAKLIIHSPSKAYCDAVSKARRTLSELHLEGIQSNQALLAALLSSEHVSKNEIHTTFIEEHLQDLLPKSAEVASSAEGLFLVDAPLRSKVVSVEVREGDTVHAGQPLLIVEAMKMEHSIEAKSAGIVRSILVSRGDSLAPGQKVLWLEPVENTAAKIHQKQTLDLDAIRPDLEEVRARHAIGLDLMRPDAVAKRRKTRQRTARENVDSLCDAGSFIEYGALALAAQRNRRTMEELIAMSPADGLVSGIGTVNAALFDAERSRCMVLAYDYTVFAGTQGAMNHKKQDRMLELAEQWRLPVVLFAEGGGGRPGDTDLPIVAALDTPTFGKMAKLSGLVPLVGIVSGRCFAGNAALLGCCDVIIATENANIGMGGPVMIEAAGLGSFSPEEIGPTAVQAKNGVVDVRVSNEEEAVAVAKRYLSYLQGSVSDWSCHDLRRLRAMIPENRARLYDPRAVIECLADVDSVLELRREFGVGMITALIRIEGRAFGLIANNPAHLAGAVDADGSDKAARFMQLCDAFGLPIVSLCDTPGFMVGPDAERAALVRHASRLFVTAASLTVPFLTVVLRRGYGLGAMSMAGGSFHNPLLTVSWPTGEFGAMGLEGAVLLAFRKQLNDIEDPEERKEMLRQMVAIAREQGKAINVASFVELDAVIDPADTRRWLLRAVQSAPAHTPLSGRRRAFIDSW